MRTGIATVCLSGTLEEKLRAAAKAGFGGIEIFETDLVTSPLSPEHVRALAADLGLGLDLYQPFRDFDSVPEELYRANLRRAEAKFRLMGRLGMDTVLVCSNVGTASIDDDALRAEQLHGLAELAARHGVKVAYEALAWGTYVNDYEHAARIVADADHPNLGTCLDTFHILSRGWDTEPIEKIPGEKIFFVQVADAPKLSMDVLSWSRHYRVFPGEGQFDLPKFLGHVARAGYNGPVSLEVFNDTFRQADVERTAVDAMRSLIWLEERTARHLAAEAAGTGSGAPSPAELARASRAYAMPLTTLPQVAPPTGINFAEVISADGAPRTAELERLLAQLGFASRGEHRTKPVSLWTLGDARIVLNRQQARGLEPAISALGFDVEDGVAAAARAVQLRAVPVPRPSQANEEILQAVNAPDGTEVFLCEDTRWVAEFGEDQADGPAADEGTDDGERSPSSAGTGSAGQTSAGQTSGGAGTARIDHINLAQPWQHFDEAVLFYSSVLALTPEASQDVSSPSGLVRSQVMQTADRPGGRAVRLALNLAPWIQSDSVKGARTDTFQEHVAIEVDDLVAHARACRGRGLPFLPIPENYYEDLDARYDLEPAFLATLRELDLLYDRDARGAFLHFYTASVGSVFFEVVQRLGGYDGFGAPNAPVRHAVQHAARHGG
ncbi:4-hydroxyphenylpyruvate dioxygenase [Sinomonas atrocyanea]|uniref:3-dehydroshikimate dehydratase n=1 Tax=Sinomonas atrocyanea TaxID=37927 RepID=A0A127A689_9MICC|nr:sugar phosphate isomerase/epimerase and 4-hydroxyphenylpyruvate domain-containing protein [Sinomonas atrocyanea]AMM34596.1 4-hydroxyphenylpyruvate dioxygenase [Sinomonas atrocyanea]GEB63074.1 4-hydroxyphenylpyruvate dioxygenase [Sinomonas atrocyanea]GGG72608.1 4-hydroxyphenylpyruvate dioxygenase [Sinomonas atrocyanea]